MDWLDPELWKKPAETFGYWQTIAAATATVGGALYAFLKWGLAAKHGGKEGRARRCASIEDRPAGWAGRANTRRRMIQAWPASGKAGLYAYRLRPLLPN